MYFKQGYEPPWSEKKIGLSTWRTLIFGCGIRVSHRSPFNVLRIPERYRGSLLRSFADWTNRTRLPCLHSVGNSVCQGPVCSSHMVFSMSSLVRATWRGALAISDMSYNNCDRMESRWDLYPLIWRITEAKTTMPTTSSEIRSFAVWMSMCVSLCICQTSFPFISSFGRTEVQGSPCTSFLVNRLLPLAQMMDHVLMWAPKFSSQKIVRFGFLVCTSTSVVKCQRM